MGEVHGAEVELPIAAWSAWAPGLDSPAAWDAWAVGRAQMATDGTPEVAFVPALTRRRLSRSARMMLWVAQQCAVDHPALRTVFVSRHGELNRTVPMLRELARDGELSPTDFSLSVHNAAAGVCSILRRDRSASVSVAGGPESFGYGLLEAALQWQLERERPVLVVYADEPVPPEYGSFVAQEPPPHALALLLSDQAQTVVRMRRVGSVDAAPSAESQSFAFLQAWLSRRPQGWYGERSSWEWRIK